MRVFYRHGDEQRVIDGVYRTVERRGQSRPDGVVTNVHTKAYKTVLSTMANNLTPHDVERIQVRGPETAL